MCHKLLAATHVFHSHNNQWNKNNQQYSIDKATGSENHKPGNSNSNLQDKKKEEIYLFAISS